MIGFAFVVAVQNFLANLSEAVVAKADRLEDFGFLLSSRLGYAVVAHFLLVLGCVV